MFRRASLVSDAGRVVIIALQCVLIVASLIVAYFTHGRRHTFPIRDRDFSLVFPQIVPLVAMPGIGILLVCLGDDLLSNPLLFALVMGLYFLVFPLWGYFYLCRALKLLVSLRVAGELQKKDSSLDRLREFRQHMLTLARLHGLLILPPWLLAFVLLGLGARKLTPAFLFAGVACGILAASVSTFPIGVYATKAHALGTDPFFILAEMRLTMVFGLVVVIASAVCLLTLPPEHIPFNATLSADGIVLVILVATFAVPLNMSYRAGKNLAAVHGMSLEEVISSNSDAFRQFLVKEFNSENLDFYVQSGKLIERVVSENLSASSDVFRVELLRLYDTFLKVSSPLEINISHGVRNALSRDIKLFLGTSAKRLTFADQDTNKLFLELLVPARDEIYRLLESDVLPRFRAQCSAAHISSRSSMRPMTRNATANESTIRASESTIAL